MKKQHTCWLIVLLACGGVVFAAPGNGPILSLSLEAGGDFPLFDSAAYFGTTADGALTADLTLPSVLPSFLSARASLGIGYRPVNPQLVSFIGPPMVISGMAGMAATYRMVPWFSLGGNVIAGYYHASASADHIPFTSVGGGGFCFSVGGEASFHIGEYFSIGFGGSYRNEVGLYQGFGASIGATGHIPFAAQPVTTVTPAATTPKCRRRSPS